MRTTFTAARRSPGPPPAHARHRAFVGRLRRRQRRERPVQRQAQVLRRVRWSFAMSNVWLQIAVRAGRAASPAVAAAIGARHTALALTTERMSAPRHTRVPARLRQVQTVERAITTVVHAERRHHTTHHTRPAPAAPPATQRPAYPRLALTLARTPSAPASVAARSDAASEPSARTARLQTNTVATQPVPLHPAELSRVTEHVLRTLDRRVLSYRERTGQV